ncbi:MAG: hypothetical protein CMN30_33745 [Sandaracinus sp.]|nr:hypothetical protein [Sandaracinus sp.]
MRFGVWLGMLLGMAGCTDHVSATPPGVLLDLNTQALGTEARGGEPQTVGPSRCVGRGPDRRDELFTLEVDGEFVATAAGPRFVDIQVRVIESRCDVDAGLAHPPTYDELAGEPRGVVTLGLGYRCADVQGSGALQVTSDAGPRSTGSWLECTSL